MKVRGMTLGNEIGSKGKVKEMTRVDYTSLRKEKLRFPQCLEQSQDTFY